MLISHSKYHDAIELLDGEFAYFVTHVLNIGKPIDTELVPTACVMADKESIKKNGVGNQFSFGFNPNFAETLSVDDYAFILAHETMHILLDHLSLAGKFQDDIRFNIAADCVINDYLVDAGLAPSDELMQNLMNGAKNVGYNCANATVGQVYDDIPQDIVDQMGQGMQLDDHNWIHVPEEFIKEILDQVANDTPIPADLQDMKDDINAKSDITNMYRGAGTGTTDVRQFIETHGVSMNWINLLKELNPDMFRMKGGKQERPSYHRRHRKLGAFPEVILPVKVKSNQNRFGEKPVIFMALDTSGSIGDETARKFITLARSIPQSEIHLEVVTFTTTVMPLNLENPQYRSGGTAFSPIEQYIRNTVMPKYKNKYPGSVVVITDGDSGFYNVKPDKEHQDRWFWLLDGYYYGYSYNAKQLFGTVKKLTEYVK